MDKRSWNFWHVETINVGDGVAVRPVKAGVQLSDRCECVYPPGRIAKLFGANLNSRLIAAVDRCQAFCDRQNRIDANSNEVIKSVQRYGYLG